jgi:hypothetical protein
MVSPDVCNRSISVCSGLDFNVKLAKQRTVPLALWERGNGGEGTIMASFIIRGGFLAMIV